MVKIAIEGCCHGSLNQIYKSLNNKSIDLLIICGDFQSLRNHADFNSLNVPKKYQQLGDFNKYYSGELKAPILTIFIGGNHECSTYLKELKYGGWVCFNIYYLGEFGSIFYKGLNIIGWSGIFNYHSFINPKLNYDEESFKKLPLDSSTIRSIYHSNLKNFIKMYLMQNSTNIDIVLSHDWPVGIEQHGDLDYLLQKKPFFEKDIESGKLGSPLNKFLIYHLKPRYWFSGHLHVKFNANITHEKYENNNKDEISLDMDDDDDDDGMEEEQLRKSLKRIKSNDDIKNPRSKRLCLNSNTEFIALDKVGKNRQFIEIKEIESSSSLHPSKDKSQLYYNKRAILINRIVEEFFNENKQFIKSEINYHDLLKNPYDFKFFNQLLLQIDQELKQTDLKEEDLIVPNNFKIIAPTINDNKFEKSRYYNNNQTDEYCTKFMIPNLKLDSS